MLVDPAMRAYYARRAREYDDWWLGSGSFADRDRPGWHEEVEALTSALAGLPPARTLDVACGTGFLTRHLPGAVTAIDQSEEMVELAARRLPDATVLRAEATPLPFADGEFERVFTSFFYGHLLAQEREPFLTEARRVAPELVVADSALGASASGEPEQWQERVLRDGSRHRVYKLVLARDGLAAELGGGDRLDARRRLVAVRHIR
jgi:ubiquinone/menaquinone biosynthesis C-methylase UbiE